MQTTRTDRELIRTAIVLTRRPTDSTPAAHIARRLSEGRPAQTPPARTILARKAFRLHEHPALTTQQRHIRIGTDARYYSYRGSHLLCRKESGPTR